MDILAQHLDNRRAEAAQRARQAEAWMGQGHPADRLLRFDTWVRAKLDELIDFTWAGTGQVRAREQCRIELERLVLDLWRRGWMLDGRRLASHIEAALADVAAAQRAGRVKEFWPFYVSVMRRYVGTNAEEIQAEALSAGSHVQGALNALLSAATARSPAQSAPSLTELLAQRRAELCARKRAANAAADDQQPRLL
jgi:hypothetical protein